MRGVPQRLVKGHDSIANKCHAVTLLIGQVQVSFLVLPQLMRMHKAGVKTLYALVEYHRKSISNGKPFNQNILQ
jgi:hypothetical protein